MEALQRIQDVKASNSYVLDLSFLGLRDLPIELSDLKQLIELNLSNNYLSRLPDWINSLENIQYIDLSNNCFTYHNGVGFELANFLNIKSINLSGNNLTQIPEDLFHLNELEDLNLDRNPLLKEIPEYIYDYGYEAIYDFVDELHSSKNTDYLLEAKMIFVGQGEVGKTSLMKEITDQTTIFIEGYEQTTHGININSWFLKTKFSEEEFRRFFNVKNYALEEYYAEYLYDENDDEENEDEEDEEDLKVINDYEDQYLSEYVESGKETSAINKPAYSKYITNDNTIQIKLNTWDFGGQEIYYSTHQFFLTKRSIYVFVWDARKEEDYRGFEYWFNTINILSEKSPIIIVMNKSDQRIKQIDEKKLKENFPNIFNFYKTSCKSGEGIKELKTGIGEAYKLLPHVGDKLPKVWVDIRNDLATLYRNFISYDQYLDICSKYKIYKDKANFLSGYLHDLGDILHFRNDEVLSKIIIINPQWVTNAFYKLIDSRLVQQNDGTFSLSNLSYVWDENIYPKEKHLELVRLIENFEICFNIVGSKDYIIPELLSNNKIHGNIYFTNNDEIKFEYRFKFLPAGLIARFICRNFLSIERKTFWKNGLVIRYEDSLALIENDVYDKKIKIAINGEDKIALLGIIRREFNYIFSNLKLNLDKDYSEMIPCICKFCLSATEPYFFEFSVLKRFSRNNKTYIPCQKSTEDVKITTLTKGYDRLKSSERVLDHLLIACSQLQGYHKNLDKKEDSRNSFIANVLNNRGLIAKDQTRWGSSPTNKSQGEIDIKIESNSGSVLGIFEGFNLTNNDKQVIHSHLTKVFDYDPNINESNYVVIYSDTQEYMELWAKYKVTALTAKYKYDIDDLFYDISDSFLCGSNIKIGKTTFSVNGEQNSVFHLFINMNL